MELISDTLIAAITAAAKDKAVGVAVDLITDSAKVAAQRLRGLLPDAEEERARALVDHILAEMAAFPPERAIAVVPLATTSDVGIWAPRGKLTVEVLWVNHADFPVRIRDVHLVARVGDGGAEWDVTKGDEFTLGPRSSKRVKLEADPLAEMPAFERGGALCELTIGALICGPWDEGRAQLTRGLIDTSLWIPALGFETRTSLLSEVEDVDLVIDDFLQRVGHGKRLQVRYGEFDITHGLRPGAAKERFEIVAKAAGHEVRPGPNVALVKVVHPNSFDARQEARARERNANPWISRDRMLRDGGW